LRSCSILEILSLIARYSLHGLFSSKTISSKKILKTSLYATTFLSSLCISCSFVNFHFSFHQRRLYCKMLERNVGESNKGSQINLLLHRRLDILCVSLQAFHQSRRKKSAKVNLFYHRFSSDLRSPVIHRRIKAKKPQTNPIVRVHTF
jgi:hypothetical protein